MRNFIKEAKILAIVFCYSDWLKHEHFLKFILRKLIFFKFILKFNYELSALPVFLKSKIFYVGKSQCRGTTKVTVQ